ncbi:E3 ubiquitin-protein ligase RNF167-like [Candoia aspera]|uniref:E3 ubiquitin-protein ligase RNF167-like n=1 Tax=Candoia aspera TaxID=51853 RepID=UPI002FD7F04B
MVTPFLILQVITKKAFIHATCNHNSTLLDLGVLPAFLWSLLPPEGLLGLWVKVKPLSIYHRIKGPPESSVFVALFHQNNRSFSKKVLYAQQVGFHAAIVYNVSSQMLEDMMREPGAKWHIHIPVVLTAEETSKILRHLHRSGKVLSAIPMPDNFHFTWKAAPTTSRLDSSNPCQCLIQLPGSCSQVAMLHTCWIFCLSVSAALIATMLTEKYLSWCKKRIKRNRRLRDHGREPVSISFTSSKYQECAICLDRYMEYDSVKVLSCSHAFHSRCIDLWHITQARCKTCPLCMQKVMVVTRLQALRLWKDGARENAWTLWAGTEHTISNLQPCLLLARPHPPRF